MGTIVVAAAAGGWWYFYGRSEEPVSPGSDPNATLAGAESDAEDAADVAALPRNVLPAADEEIIKPGTAQPKPTARPPIAGAEPETRHASIQQARQLLAADKVIQARAQLNALLSRNLVESEAVEVRGLLVQIADDTIFGRRRVPGDPLVDTYTIAPGEYLINVAKQFHVPHEVLMRVNGIESAKRIRADQQIKVLRGPFHAQIHKSKYRLDVYLGDTYVCSYQVGLGTDDGTPEGVWRVKERLTNPTYYPSASNPDKRIIAADDPNNPLGERWIGLEGIEGGAVGQVGYGIHGTIEPESVGRSVSLGCIRMKNEDVAEFYTFVLPGQSTVTILP